MGVARPKLGATGRGKRETTGSRVSGGGDSPLAVARRPLRRQSRVSSGGAAEAPRPAARKVIEGAKGRRGAMYSYMCA
jgi:hypothetical protein